MREYISPREGRAGPGMESGSLESWAECGIEVGLEQCKTCLLDLGMCLGPGEDPVPLPPRQSCLGLWHHSLLCHVQNPVPDVVRGHLPVSVNEAATPTILAH